MSISGLKQENCFFACPHGRYFYIKLFHTRADGHNNILMSFLLLVADEMNWNWRMLEKLSVEKAFKKTYCISSNKHHELLINFEALRWGTYWRTALKKGRRFSQRKTRKAKVSVAKMLECYLSIIKMPNVSQF